MEEDLSKHDEYWLKSSTVIEGEAWKRSGEVKKKKNEPRVRQPVEGEIISLIYTYNCFLFEPEKEVETLFCEFTGKEVPDRELRFNTITAGPAKNFLELLGSANTSSECYITYHQEKAPDEAYINVDFKFPDTSSPLNGDGKYIKTFILNIHIGGKKYEDKLYLDYQFNRESREYIAEKLNAFPSLIEKLNEQMPRGSYQQKTEQKKRSVKSWSFTPVGGSEFNVNMQQASDTQPQSSQNHSYSEGSESGGVYNRKWEQIRQRPPNTGAKKREDTPDNPDFNKQETLRNEKAKVSKVDNEKEEAGAPSTNNRYVPPSQSGFRRRGT